MRDTVPRDHGRIDPIHVDHAIAVIEGHVDAAKMSVLLKHPRRHVVKLLIGPVTDQLLRQIHMHFPRGPTGCRADPA